jgi:hypothetical protein
MGQLVALPELPSVTAEAASVPAAGRGEAQHGAGLGHYALTEH